MIQNPTEISVQELALKLAHPNPDIQMIDVREPHEVAIAALPGFDVLPLSDFAEWSETITERYNLKKETLVLCHHGMRSDRMCHWLADMGFSCVKNIVGGIDAYARVVDPQLPRY
ncbi:MAG: rhodanese-like domain-containing protein [Synechocystis sp.]|jgi:rhodanese-related sulfurtransferase